MPPSRTGKKRAILIGCLLMLNKTDGKKSWKKKKRERLKQVNSFRGVSHKTSRKSSKERDHVGSFGTMPGPILREPHWTGNGAI